jgi:integrase
VAIPRGYRLRPVKALQAWVAAAEISSGPVFRAVALGGKVSDAPLADNRAARIVKQYARRVGLDPVSYPGHSLRSGFLTSAAESGASIWKLSGSRVIDPWTRCVAIYAGLTCSRSTLGWCSCNSWGTKPEIR